MTRGGPKGNAHRGVPPSDRGDNIERIATNVRIEGTADVHKRRHGAEVLPACSSARMGRRVFLTTAERTCTKPGCRGAAS